MKAHIGVHSATKVIHAVVATAANVVDCTILPDLLHGNETRMWGDQAYCGQREAIRQVALAAQDFTNRRCRHIGRMAIYVRRLRDSRLAAVGVEVEEDRLNDYAVLCGRTLGCAH